MKRWMNVKNWQNRIQIAYAIASSKISQFPIGHWLYSSQLWFSLVFILPSLEKVKYMASQRRIQSAALMKCCVSCMNMFISYEKTVFLGSRITIKMMQFSLSLAISGSLNHVVHFLSAKRHSYLSCESLIR